jgi:hypothetical protein
LVAEELERRGNQALERGREIETRIAAQQHGAAGEIILMIHWNGGVPTELRAQTPKALLDAVTVLARICSDDLIAGILNRNGMLPGRGNRWTLEI